MPVRELAFYLWIKFRIRLQFAWPLWSNPRSKLLPIEKIQYTVSIYLVMKSELRTDFCQKNLT